MGQGQASRTRAGSGGGVQRLLLKPRRELSFLGGPGPPPQPPILDRGSAPAPLPHPLSYRPTPVPSAASLSPREKPSEPTRLPGARRQGSLVLRHVCPPGGPRSPVRAASPKSASPAPPLASWSTPASRSTQSGLCLSPAHLSFPCPRWTVLLEMRRPPGPASCLSEKPQSRQPNWG